MCGIAGWYRRGGRVPRAVVQAQCEAILHRGPDDDGVLVDGDFGFGMRRLSILDVAGGHQPMEAAGGRFAIVFNGEIYNHLDLRPSLAAHGHVFTTHSDTETVLAAFALWGNEAWAKLEGMFAVAIWDRRARELTLARDPIGIKPLYLSEQRGGLAFASELKALRVLPDHDFTIDERAVHDFFSFGHVRRSRSIFREVISLQPAHFLTIAPEGPKEIRRYWRPQFSTGASLTPTDWIDQMRSVLMESTARHMQSDVPVGAFLSGGIDSSAILAAARRATGQPVKAFTIGYPGAKIDETDAARRIAAHLGCEHAVLPLDIPDATEVLPTVLRCFDEPFADMAAIPTWFASKLAGEEVKVVLCGEGGDELFAGYKRHRNAALIERYRPLLGSAGLLGAAVDRIPLTRWSQVNYLRQHAQRALEFLGLPDGFQQFFAATQITGPGLRKELYTTAFWRRHEMEDSYGALEREYFPGVGAHGLSALEQFLFADLTMNMPSAMLTRLDRASMAHSVEARVPFLSHKVVDWALTVPTNLKMHGNTGKFLLRKAVAPWLPPDILKRPKQGFQIPYASWMRGRLGDFAREVWNESGAAGAGYLNPATVERLFAQHKRGEANHGRILYAIAVFGLWWRDTLPGPARSLVNAR